jgi:hypothetical protein
MLELVERLCLEWLIVKNWRPVAEWLVSVAFSLGGAGPRTFEAPKFRVPACVGANDQEDTVDEHAGA